MEFWTQILAQQFYSLLVINFSVWDIYCFKKDTLDIRAKGREGPFGRKLIKNE